MSASPKLLAHDLEKGHPTAPRGSVFVLPQRRRKLIIASLLLFATLFFVYAAERNGSLLSSSSWRWVKDSMKPASLQEGTTSQTVETDVHALSTPSPPPPTDAASLGAHEVKTALTDLGSEKHASLPGASAEEASSAKAVQRDQVLLLLSAMKNKEYRVPELQVQRAEELMPSSIPAFVKALDKVQGKDAADSKLYADARASWQAKHRAASPLTVFSKSYCPYSQKAKALLTGMRVQFDVYEVDLREDARSLQDALREVSGHSTFPAIFVKDDLLGGSDDLARLHDMEALDGILKAAGVHFI